VQTPRDIWNVVAVVIGVVLLAVAGPWIVHQVRTLPHAGALAARADQRIVTLEVGGMTCKGCAGTVRGTLATVPGVTGVDVRFAQRRAYVVCEKGVADSSLTAAVSRAGPGFLATVAVR